MKSGSACPDCAQLNTKAKLRNDEPKVFVRLQGGPLVSGTRYIAQRLYCEVCNMRYEAGVPEAIKKAPKYDVSCATTLAIARYSLGLPMYRIEHNQSMHGIPLKDATQWDLLKGLYPVSFLVHETLIHYAANGNLMLYDDTSGRLLANKAKGLATHTTAFISVYEGHKIHLFFTGNNHAGKNTELILSQRTRDEQVIAMMDASPSNRPKNISATLMAQLVLCFCLVHSRRKFFEVFHFFDKECDFVLDVFSRIYAADAHCAKHNLSPEARLRYHQTHSRPLMDSLYIWLNNQLLYDQQESNNGLGQAVKYMLKHWVPLTQFLRVAGAPLDNSWAERAIKIAIRYRRNSLFYKTTQGALVGDCLMGLIYTASQNGINPYDYLNALQHHAKHVQLNPASWLPWTYQATLAQLNQKQAA